MAGDTVNFNDWASDASPSAPEGRPSDMRVRMGGFCFTETGIAVDVSDVEAELMAHPPYGPITSAGHQ